MFAGDSRDAVIGLPPSSAQQTAPSSQPCFFNQSSHVDVRKVPAPMTRRRCAQAVASDPWTIPLLPACRPILSIFDVSSLVAYPEGWRLRSPGSLSQIGLLSWGNVFDEACVGKTRDSPAPHQDLCRCTAAAPLALFCASRARSLLA